jgi:hypothetical protein
MLKLIYSEALKGKRQRSAVDLGSNGCQRACAVDRTVSSAHGSTVDRPLNAKGYVIWAINARSKGSGHLQAKATASTPECGGTRRRTRRRGPRSRCGAPKRARVGSTCS